MTTKSSAKRVVLPEGFVKTRYNGYFWNVQEQTLYSIKIKGILRKLKRQTDLRKYWRFGTEAMKAKAPEEYFYQVSVNGKVKVMTDNYLKSLTLTSGIVPTDKRKRSTPLGNYENEDKHENKKEINNG